MICCAMWTIIQANRHVYEESGYEEGEVIGENITTLFTDASKEICDCNFPGLRERGYNRVDIEFVCKDGRVLQMDCSETAVPDENGEFTSFLIVQRDRNSFAQYSILPFSSSECWTLMVFCSMPTRQHWTL